MWDREGRAAEPPELGETEEQQPQSPDTAQPFPSASRGLQAAEPPDTDRDRRRRQALPEGLGRRWRALAEGLGQA